MSFEPAGDPAERLRRFIATGKLDAPPEVIASSAESVREYNDQLRRRRIQNAIDQAKTLSEIGPFFSERTFQNFRASMFNQEALDAALAVAKQPTTLGLGIFGEMGNGKSHLAGAIVNAAIAQGIAATFISTVALLLRLQATQKRNAIEDELVLVKHYAAVPVLVLDDLGKERLTEWGAKTLYAIVDARYTAKLPLIVTANDDLDELVATKYARLHEQRGNEGLDPSTGLAILDRVLEMTGEWVQNRAQGERPKIAQERTRMRKPPVPQPSALRSRRRRIA